jgi:type III restriction enzyme
MLESNPAYKNAIENIDGELVDEIEDTINAKFKFRPYQKQALMAFDWIIDRSIKEDSIISYLKDEQKCGDVPIIGFEMATGSGKTLLIGAFITYLHLKHNINNFLILTPPRGKSAIYDKTIRNFDLNDKACVLSNSFEKKFNLVTGENYIDKSSNYDKDAELNIFVMNINKFFESSAGIKNVDKPWEESFWKDSSDNVISFRNYLNQLDDLVIITDEAHHFQKYSQSTGDEVESGRGNSAGDIVSSINPKYLIEFTATMVADQKPIYRYSVNNYISDGYGKKVRAWGINTNPEKGLWDYDISAEDEKKQVTDSDASKIVRAISVHMIKKAVLDYEKNKNDKRRKPILLVKARNTDHAESILTYIKQEIPKKVREIEEIYDQIIIDNEYEINNLIQKHITKEQLTREIEKIGDKSFSFHTKNETKETLELFNSLEENEMEVIIQVDKATEGWNIDNVYTILILSNNRGEIKTNVKQLIGRGLRLLREKRIYDESEDKLKKEEELLHIVCEQGNNFALFIEEIRRGLGLNSENFRNNIVVKDEKNNITIQDMTKYNDLRLPEIKRESEPKIKEPQELIDKLNFNDLSLDDFAKQVGNPWQEIKENGVILKWTEEDQTQEVDVTSGIKIKEGISDSMEEELLTISEIQRSRIIREIIRNQNLIPSDEKVDKAIRESMRELTDNYSFYYKQKYGTNEFWQRKFSNDLINFISKKIDMNFEPKTVIKNFNEFKRIFTDHNISIEYDGDRAINKKTKEQIRNYFYENKKEIPKYHVTEYKKSYFTYNKFDSSQEAKLAELIDNCENVEMWIKNRRFGQFIIKYELNKNFSPDFIIKLKDSNKIYIIEVKGEGLKEASKEKREVMNDANKISNDKFQNIFLWDKTVDELYKNAENIFQNIIEKNDL